MDTPSTVSPRTDLCGWSPTPGSVSPSLPPNAPASLRQAGLHSLRFEPLAPITVAYRMGYRYPFVEGLATNAENQPGAGGNLPDRVRHIQERLRGLKYEVEEGRIDAVFYYPLHYDLYPVYFPYQQIKETHAELCQLLVTFLVIAGKFGLGFWFESYHSDSLIWAMEDEEECFFGEDNEGEAWQIVREAKAMRAAASRVRIKKPDTLKRKLTTYRVKDEREAAMISILLRWVDFLKQDDHIDHYAGRDDGEDEGYEEIWPHDRFIIMPYWGETADEWWQESLRQGQWASVEVRFSLDETLVLPAIPIFPMQLAQMIEDIIEAMEQLTETSHD